ncbi:MAG: hypothetical protein KAH77_08055 [Thiomargarita sp.]|nr:hypothetical protein [Thiomargarita sp.]
MNIKIFILLSSFLLNACIFTKTPCSFPHEKGQAYWVCHPEVLISVGSSKSRDPILKRENCKAVARLKLIEQIKVIYPKQLNNKTVTLIGSQVDAWNRSHAGTMYCLISITPGNVQKSIEKTLKVKNDSPHTKE